MVRTGILSFICAVLLIATAYAEDNALQGIKLGFGFDRDFGITGAIGDFNGFLGNDGVAVDYIFVKQKLDEANPLYWYVGGGGFIDWDGDFGARLPVGGELYFAENFDAYAQLIPRLRFNNNSKDNRRTNFGLDFAIGVRYQF